MGYDIGPKIGIDGEADFRKSISDINTSLKTFGTEMKVVTSRFDDNADAQVVSSAKYRVLNEQVEAQKKKLSLLKEGLEESTKKYGENDEKTQRWKQTVNVATAELNGMEKELRQSAEKINTVSKEEVEAEDKTEKLGKGFDSASKKSLSFSDVLAANLLSDAIKAGFKALAEGVKKLGSALIDMSTNAANYADDVATMSSQLSLSTDTIQGMKYASELLDVEVEAQARGLAKVTKAIGTAGEAGKDYITVADGLTVSTVDANGQLKSSEQVYYDAIDALGQIKNSTEQETAAQELFGKSYQDIMPLIDAGSEGLKEMTAQAKENGYVLSGEALDALNDYKDSLDELENSKTAFTNSVGALMAPAMQVFSEAATNATTAMTQLVNGDIDTEEFSAKIQGIVTGLSDTINQNLPAILEVGGGILGAIFQGLVSAIPTLATSAVSMINQISSSLNENLPAIISAAMQILGALGQGLLDNLPLLITSAISIISQIGTGLIEALPQLLDAALQIIQELANGLITALPELIPTIVDIMLQLVETLIDNIDMLVDTALQLMQALADGLIEALPKLMEKAPELIEKLIEAITDNLPKIIEMGIELIIQLAAGLIKAIPDLIKAIPEIIGALIEGILGMGPDLLEAGKGIINEIKDGIKKIDPLKWGKDIIDSLIKGIKDGIKKVKEAVADVADAVKDFLGFSEPKEGPLSNFHTFMPDMIDLMTKGIIGNKNKVTSALKGLAADMSGAIPTDISTTVSANAKYGAKGFNAGKTAGISIVIENFNNNTQEDISILAEKLAFETQRRLRGSGYVYA